MASAPKWIQVVECYDHNQAGEVRALLEAEGIACEVKHTGGYADPTFTFTRVTNPLAVLVEANDFGRARKVLGLSEDSKSELESEIQTLTDEELKQILIEKGEWEERWVELAAVELKRRNVVFEEKEIEERKKAKSQEQQAPVALRPAIKGLLIGLGVMASLVVLVMALFIIYSRRKLPDGTRVIHYDKSSRTFASIVFVIGLIWTIGLSIFLAS